MNANIAKSPQQQLREAIAALVTALNEASKAVASTEATVASIQQAMTSLAQAQQGYNNAVIRIPLRVVTASFDPAPPAE